MRLRHYNDIEEYLTDILNPINRWQAAYPEILRRYYNSLIIVHLIASGQMEAKAGVSFAAGRMGNLYH